jgi:hypothetical protein
VVFLAVSVERVDGLFFDHYINWSSCMAGASAHSHLFLVMTPLSIKYASDSKYVAFFLSKSYWWMASVDVVVDMMIRTLMGLYRLSYAMVDNAAAEQSVQRRRAVYKALRYS